MLRGWWGGKQVTGKHGQYDFTYKVKIAKLHDLCFTSTKICGKSILKSEGIINTDFRIEGNL